MASAETAALEPALEKLRHAIEEQSEMLRSVLANEPIQECAPPKQQTPSIPTAPIDDRVVPEVYRKEIARLWNAVREQGEELRALTSKMSALLDYHSELRGLLLEAHAQLLRRDLESELRLTDLQQVHQIPTNAVVSVKKEAATHQQDESVYLRYRHLLNRLKAVVQARVPAGAIVIVVSKGDGELVRLNGRIGWHFPQTDNGVYAGHYPADSAAAVEHLEFLRTRGGKFLLFPGTAFWWLDHYKDFARYLQSRFVCVHQDGDGLLFDLSATSVEAR
jgi:hypothetical protein